MKRKLILLMTVVAATIGNAGAQKIATSEVPSAVMNAFQSKFRDARDINWEKKTGYYKADFEIGRRDAEIRYDDQGAVVYYEEELDLKTLPQPVMQTIQKQYPDASVKKAKKIEERGTLYRVEIKGSRGKEWELDLNEQGKLLSERRD